MRSLISRLAVTGIVVLFGLAIVRLYGLRFASGDIYPPYSSLRADPLGTRVLFESLDALPGVRVERHFRAPRHWPQGRGAALLLFGLPVWELSGEQEELQELERFVQEGGRLVITLRSDGFSRPRTTSSATTNPPPARLRFRPADSIELSNRWGFFLTSVATGQEKEGAPPPRVVRAAGEGLPAELAWHSDGVFLTVTNPWHAVYTRDTNAVLIERRMGSGTIALATDSYPVSNEALRDHRAPGLLAWIVGDARRVVFNETHLGVSEEPGFASLARRYRLQLFFAVLGAVAALFVWQAAASFVPPPAETVGDAPPVTGRDAAGGFASLLRRNIKPDALLALCLTEWTRSGHGGRRISPERLGRVQTIVDRENEKPATQRDAVAVYREIAQALRPVPAAPAGTARPSRTKTQPHS